MAWPSIDAPSIEQGRERRLESRNVVNRDANGSLDIQSGGRDVTNANHVVVMASGIENALRRL